MQKKTRLIIKGKPVKKLHLAIATNDIEASVKDYNVRFGIEPCLYIKNEYALWRTEALNVSIRQDKSGISGELRHLGWEDDTVLNFSEEKDVNGIIWERFSAQQQADEINALWTEANYTPK